MAPYASETTDGCAAAERINDVSEEYWSRICVCAAGSNRDRSGSSAGGSGADATVTGGDSDAVDRCGCDRQAATARSATVRQRGPAFVRRRARGTQNKEFQKSNVSDTFSSRGAMMPCGASHVA